MAGKEVARSENGFVCDKCGAIEWAWRQIDYGTEHVSWKHIVETKTTTGDIHRPTLITRFAVNGACFEVECQEYCGYWRPFDRIVSGGPQQDSDSST